MCAHSTRARGQSAVVTTEGVEAGRGSGRQAELPQARRHRENCHYPHVHAACAMAQPEAKRVGYIGLGWVGLGSDWVASACAKCNVHTLVISA